jgi:hypothetical protein
MELDDGHGGGDGQNEDKSAPNLKKKKDKN